MYFYLIKSSLCLKAVSSLPRALRALHDLTLPLASPSSHARLPSPSPCPFLLHFEAFARAPSEQWKSSMGSLQGWLLIIFRSQFKCDFLRVCLWPRYSKRSFFLPSSSSLSQWPKNSTFHNLGHLNTCLHICDLMNCIFVLIFWHCCIFSTQHCAWHIVNSQ